MRRWPARAIVASPGALVWATPGVAWACPACYSAGGEGMLAYLWTAVLLSILPLAMIGGIVVTVRRRTRAHRLSVEPDGQSPGQVGPTGSAG
jgi:hypothetical protein